MIVSHLSLVDFRNYASLDLPLQPGPNLFVGSNGQGKTNLVEAIGYLSTLGSHRVSADHAMIRQGAAAAIIRARLEHGGRSVLLEVELNRGSANRAQVNRAAVRPRELTRYCSTVLFAPEDLALVRGEPAGRRRFLDELLAMLTPRLSSVLSDYDRVLRQRNTLLKSARSARVRTDQLSTLEIWDERLIALGSEIIAERSALVAKLEPHVDAAYSTIVAADHGVRLAGRLTVFAAHPDDDDSDDNDARSGPLAIEHIAEAFRAALDRMRPAELDRGQTLVGPHRDDLHLELNGLPARGYASHGESWSFALALKIAAAEVLRRESAAGDPVLVLDDVFAELDEARRGRLAGAIAGYEQVLITAAVLGDVPEQLTAHLVHISAGQVVGDG